MEGAKDSEFNGREQRKKNNGEEMERDQSLGLDEVEHTFRRLILVLKALAKAHGRVVHDLALDKLLRALPVKVLS